MMELFMTPGSCSTGIHIIMEELDILFSAHILNLPKGDHLTDEYKAINPKCTIPALRFDDGAVLSDFDAIAWWLASRYPKKQLLPQNPLDQAKVIEVMNYVTGTLHGQGFTRIFTPEKYILQGDDDIAKIKEKGHEIVSKSFAIIAESLGNPSGYLFDHFTIADAALFYTEFWAIRIEIEMPDRCVRHYKNMCQRRVVQRVLAEEGYRLTIE
jgi:glutathione S-transferase